jgi:hypothetical protein
MRPDQLGPTARASLAIREALRLYLAHLENPVAHLAFVRLATSDPGVSCGR